MSSLKGWKKRLTQLAEFEHDLDCPFWRAYNGNVGIECDHGYDVCPICDPCACLDGLVLILEEFEDEP